MTHLVECQHGRPLTCTKQTYSWFAETLIVFPGDCDKKGWEHLDFLLRMGRNLKHEHLSHFSSLLPFTVPSSALIMSLILPLVTPPSPSLPFYLSVLPSRFYLTRGNNGGCARWRSNARIVVGFLIAVKSQPAQHVRSQVNQLHSELNNLSRLLNGALVRQRETERGGKK